ncbi:shufflon system plasmid conjugative transfer pilus tip adhesin PilV [Salmonella enterica]|uniref:Shufflon system plasmid conjugative transfer pilus tip adhesin PilV n=1 Tax=Salmonella enterica subsp. salamae serovar 47:b:1,5 TaxID=1967619 RepID=A0A701UAN8_SALER|nr:shufflon system plasmid conjugative transfer pilus tip adhesin PilV [Salmonella enterica]EHO4503086.1 shufflon system plasmid conjugative transfer pilus tip adhesin PilV [Salmonella enterica]HAC6516974.1 shufflon system plasmid conjugative transfer pilus tip adhesin PilV [Salmonella enterica subsp. salamae serovar 47:b:1,5]HAE2327585.1 shufflon system plasmid conjugative transfer pilus tip adhesin PilV [Salmonella enterica subsp. diarizonae serovar 65:(k):z]
MKEIKQKGFSLLELTLVLGIGTVIAFVKFQDMKTNQENMMADTVGNQIKQIGEAVNRYISIHYDKLSTLSSSSSQSSDPGPRVCSGNSCEITYQTLVNEGLLPVSYTGINMQKSSYKIVLKRSGIAPNFVINGLITTTSPWLEGGKYRYDLLGKSMQVAGIDSGMTQSATLVSGLQGTWTETSSAFNNITAAGLLAYRVGYDSSMYSVYLRRDGTLPMTGNLNMGNQDINNARNIAAAGTITTEVLRTGGAAAIGTKLDVGGVATLNSDLNVAGNGQVNGNLNSNNSVSGTTITSRGETYTNNWFRAMGEGGIYFQKYGGGWYMTDTNTITAYAGKNIQTAAGVYGGYVHSTGNIDAVGHVYGAGGVVSGGRTTVGEYLQLNGVAYAGNGCSPNGLQGRAVDGSILSCTNGVWKEGGGSVNRMFIVVEGKCYVPNKDTGGCSCPNDPNRLKQIEVSRYRGNECNNGGSNCREPDRRLYTCN